MKVCKFCGRPEENGICPVHGDTVVEEWEYWTSKVTAIKNELTELLVNSSKSGMGNSDKIFMGSQISEAIERLDEIISGMIRRHRR